jgi:hypothetical protein
MAQVVEGPPSKLEALSSNPSATKKKKKKERKINQPEQIVQETLS